MLGVVIWSDPAQRKAVFWCEDHGDLAFHSCDGTAADAAWVLEAGDMVRFEVSRSKHLRNATNAEVVRQRACHDLPERLRGIAQTSEDIPARPSKTVVPLGGRISPTGPTLTV